MLPYINHITGLSTFYQAFGSKVLPRLQTQVIWSHFDALKVKQCCIFHQMFCIWMLTPALRWKQTPSGPPPWKFCCSLKMLKVLRRKIQASDPPGSCVSSGGAAVLAEPLLQRRLRQGPVPPPVEPAARQPLPDPVVTGRPARPGRQSSASLKRLGVMVNF